MNPTPYLQRILAAQAEPEEGAMGSSLQENEIDEALENSQKSEIAPESNLSGPQAMKSA